MGTSTDGEISFGFVFKESHEFPWDADPWDGDVEDWWKDNNGFKHSVEIWDENSEYLPGIEQGCPEYEKYYEEMFAWEKANPIPFERINYCSCECGMYIIAVKSSVRRCSRGYPQKLHKTDFQVDIKDLSDFLEFCQKYGIMKADDQEPSWYLTSYWSW